LQRAAILAMRDAAALMIMKLDETTGISKMAELRATIADPESSAVEESSDESK